MSMLSAQIKELRETAVSLGVNGVCTGDLSKLYVMLREAADTIESLSDKLQGVMGTRYCELFGTPEKVADYFATQCMGGDGYTCEICPFADCDGRLHADPHSTIRNELLEWLRGDA